MDSNKLLQPVRLRETCDRVEGPRCIWSSVFGALQCQGLGGYFCPLLSFEASNASLSSDSSKFNSKVPIRLRNACDIRIPTNIDI